MRRRLRMKELEDVKYINMESIRSTIEEINRKREFKTILKSDTTPPP